MSTTARGAPYPVDGDSNDVTTWVKNLAAWVNDRPGIATLSTTQRNALASAELWAGRVIWNTTTSRHEVYNGATWSALIPNTDTNWAAAGIGGWTGAVSYIRRSGMVTLAVEVNRSAFNPGDGICTLPPGFAPPAGPRVISTGTYGHDVRPFAVYPSGQVLVAGDVTQYSGIFGSVTYPAAL